MKIVDGRWIIPAFKDSPKGEYMGMVGIKETEDMKSSLEWLKEHATGKYFVWFNLEVEEPVFQLENPVDAAAYYTFDLLGGL